MIKRESLLDFDWRMALGGSERDYLCVVFAGVLAPGMARAAKGKRSAIRTDGTGRRCAVLAKSLAALAFRME